MTAGVVAVTGATGFLGSHLVHHLRAEGWAVRILVRKPRHLPWSDTAGLDIIAGDLEDAQALAKLVDGADVVVHLAGLIKARDRRSFFRVNEDGARAVARASLGKRLIHVSSLAAREPTLSAYAASKRAGEDAVLRIDSTTTIVRPPIIYGAGDRETLALFKAARGPVVFVPGVSLARVAVAEVDDVATVLQTLVDDPASSAAITIGGAVPSGYSWLELAQAAAKAIKGRPLIVKTPPWALRSAGVVCEHVGSWRATNPIFTLGKAREALHADWSVSEAEEGWTSGRTYTALEEGFARTVDWYRSRGWIE